MLPAPAFKKEEEIGNSYDKIPEEIQIVCDRNTKKGGYKTRGDKLGNPKNHMWLVSENFFFHVYHKKTRCL